MSQNMSSFIYMLSKTKGIYYTTDFVEIILLCFGIHGS